MQQEGSKEMAKKELQKYRGLCLEVKKLEEEIDELRSRIIYHRNEGERHSGSGGDQMAEAIARLVDLTTKRQETLLQRIAERDRISSAIDSLEDPEERMIIHARYVQGKRWNAIYMDHEGKEHRSLLRIHARALEKIAEFFRNDTKCHINMS